MTRVRVLVGAAVWLATWVLLWISDADPSPVALAGICTVIAASCWVAVDLGRSALRVRWPLARRSPRAVDDTRRVPRSLRDTEALLSSPPGEVHRALVAVVDERLRRRHGVDRRVAPDAADLLLTPALLRFVTVAPRRALNERELWALLNDIEAV